MPMWWWGVNYSSKRCLCGHPVHIRAGLALRCSTKHVCISVPVVHVSVECAIYTCMNAAGGTYSWYWMVTAHCRSDIEEGELLTFSLVL